MSSAIVSASVAVLEAENGRGLHIVDALATAWGVEAGNGTKRVWCDIAVR